MTEDPEDRTASMEPVEPEHVQEELFPLVREQIEIEHRRIESNDRRTEIIRDAIKASTAAEELQYKYHMARLESDERVSQSRHLLAKKVIYVGGGVLIVVAALLFWMLFFGDPTQTSTAKELLSALGIAVGGGGVLHLLSRAMRRLFNY